MARRQFACARHQRGRVRQHVVEQLHFARSLRAVVATGKDPFARGAIADHARQALQRAHVGHHRDARLTHRERRFGRGQPDVARRDQVHARTDARAVHRGDDRLVGVGEARARVLVRADVVVQLAPLRDRRAFAARQRTAAAETLRVVHQVDAGAERLALAREHDHAHVRIGIERRHRRGNAVPQRAVQRVQLFRAVEEQRGDAAVAFDGEVGKRLGHGRSSWWFDREEEAV